MRELSFCANRLWCIGIHLVFSEAGQWSNEPQTPLQKINKIIIFFCLRSALQTKNGSNLRYFGGVIDWGMICISVDADVPLCIFQYWNIHFPIHAARRNNVVWREDATWPTRSSWDYFPSIARLFNRLQFEWNRTMSSAIRMYWRERWSAHWTSAATGAWQ